MIDQGSSIVDSALNLTLCHLCALCASVVNLNSTKTHHRGTEFTEDPQRFQIRTLCRGLPNYSSLSFLFFREFLSR